MFSLMLTGLLLIAGRFAQPKNSQTRAVLKPEPKPEPVAQKPVAAVPELLSVPAKKRVRNFAEQVLDELPHYMEVADLLRKKSPQDYHIINSVGAQLLAGHSWAHMIPDLAHSTTLSPWWHNNRPAHGATMFSVGRHAHEHELREQAAWPRIFVFDRFKGFESWVQRFPGDHYKVTIVWEWHGKLVLDNYAVAITASGKIVILNIRQRMRQQIRHKKRDQGVLGPIVTSTITHQHWGLPEPLIEWARESDQDPHSFLARLFVLCCNTFEVANYEPIRVSIEKNHLRATINLPFEDPVTFFADRDITASVNGQRKRIFHIVRTHIRRNGTRVPSHFRGLREFTWHGYNIHITVPEWHHRSLAEFDVAAENPSITPNAVHIDAAGLGDMLHSVIAEDRSNDIRRRRRLANVPQRP